MDKLLSPKEASQILGIEESYLIQLAEEGKIPAYKIGGTYLRFRKDQLNHFKKNSFFSQKQDLPSGLIERFKDFFYFYDFYLLSLLIILILLWLIFQR